jgi:hypothetical protein
MELVIGAVIIGVLVALLRSPGHYDDSGSTRAAERERRWYGS